MNLIVDGNDGTGKSTLCAALRARGLTVADRGLPTRMTDDPALAPGVDDFYLILDARYEKVRRNGVVLSCAVLLCAIDELHPSVNRASR